MFFDGLEVSFRWRLEIYKKVFVKLKLDFKGVVRFEVGVGVCAIGSVFIFSFIVSRFFFCVFKSCCL